VLDAQSPSGQRERTRDGLRWEARPTELVGPQGLYVRRLFKIYGTDVSIVRMAPKIFMDWPQTTGRSSINSTVHQSSESRQEVSSPNPSS
jgi:hypothetical protein